MKIKYLCSSLKLKIIIYRHISTHFNNSVLHFAGANTDTNKRMIRTRVVEQIFLYIKLGDQIFRIRNIIWNLVIEF